MPSRVHLALVLPLFVSMGEAASPSTASAQTAVLSWKTPDDPLQVTSPASSVRAEIGEAVTLHVWASDYFVNGNGVSEARLTLSYDSNALLAQNAETCPVAGLVSAPCIDISDNLEALSPVAPATIANIGAGSTVTFHADQTPVNVDGVDFFLIGSVEFVVQSAGTVSLLYTGAEGVYDEASVQYTTPATAVVHLGSVGQYTVDASVDGEDANPGDDVCATAGGDCTLRAAIDEANAIYGPDDITIPAGTYALTVADFGLVVLDDTRFLGADSSCSTGAIVTQGGGRVGGLLSLFRVSTVSGLCLTGATSDGDAALVAEWGSRVLVRDVRIESNVGNGILNSAAYPPGGLAAAVTRVEQTTISGNTQPDQFGPTAWAVVNEADAALSLYEVEISANGGGHAFQIGGGINNVGTMSVANSAIDSSRCRAVANGSSGRFSMSNVSIWDNGDVCPIAVPAFENTGYALLTNVTIEDDLGNSGSGTLELRNSIVMAPCAGVSSGGYNVESGTSCGFTGTGDQQSTAITLNTDASGPTPTRVPASATNVQDLGGEDMCPLVDQRGLHRPPGSCDRGAAELSAAAACDDGLDNDGDGLCDTLGGTCTDGSTPGDPGCSDPSDPQELTLLQGDIVSGQGSDRSVVRIDPATGDVVRLTRGMGLWATFNGAFPPNGRLYFSDGFLQAIWEIDLDTGRPWLFRTGFDPVAPGPRLINVDSKGNLLVPALDELITIDPDSGAETVLSTALTGSLIEFASEDPTDGSFLATVIGAGPVMNGVYRLHPTTGAVLESFTGGLMVTPRQHVLMPNARDLYLADNGAGRLIHLDLDTGVQTDVTAPTALTDAWGVVLEQATGDLLVAQRGTGDVVRVDPNAGTATPVTTSLGFPLGLALVGPGVDSDLDGIGDLVEDAAPNGGDGNDDGTPDSEQSDVASVPDAEGVGYLTLQVSGGCSVATSVMTMTESDAPELDPSHDYPFGLIGFVLPCSSAQVKLWFHGTSALVPPYRKYGPTIPGVPATADWYDLPGVTFGSESVGGATVATVSFTLSDGVLGDDTGVDGLIVDMGGPAAGQVPALPPAALGLLALALVAAARPRRKRTGTIRL